MNIKAIRERLEKASPKPWVITRYKDDPSVDGIVDANGDKVIETDSGVYPPSEHDAQFIVHSLKDIEDMLSVIEKQRQALRKVLLHQPSLSDPWIIIKEALKLMEER